MSAGWLRRHLDDAMYCRPRGPLGRVGARRMARDNALSEAWAIGRLDEALVGRVLVVGPGPGVGLDLAANAAGAGNIVAVEPSRLMRKLAARRCARHIATGVVRITCGTAENTGCADSSVDAVISVNNVMLWDQVAAFAELHRVLRRGGALILAEHQHGDPDRIRILVRAAEAAGFAVPTSAVERGSAIRLVAVRLR
jgi:SAM-dependent methyltransferase